MFPVLKYKLSTALLTRYIKSHTHYLSAKCSLNKC